MLECLHSRQNTRRTWKGKRKWCDLLRLDTFEILTPASNASVEAYVDVVNRYRFEENCFRIWAIPVTSRTFGLLRTSVLKCSTSTIAMMRRASRHSIHQRWSDDLMSTCNVRFRNGENGYILRPEVMEGIFYLWRLTGKQVKRCRRCSNKNLEMILFQKYRDWMWDAITSINKHLRVEHGFTGLHNVYNPSQVPEFPDTSYFSNQIPFRKFSALLLKLDSF